MNKKCILVCDDSLEQRQIAERILGKKYDVKHSVHYQHLAQDLAQHGPVQLLLLDLHFTGDKEPYAGRKAIPELVREHPNLKIIILSSILVQVKDQPQALEISRELLRYPQVVGFLSTGDNPARVEFEVNKALGTPEWIKDDQFNLLHVSDVQFGGPGLLGTPREQAARITECIEGFVDGDPSKGENLPRRFPEFVILSGDLTQQGRPEQFEEAREFALGLSKFVTDRSPHMASLTRDNLIVIPGNHDVNWDISRARSLIKDSTGWKYQADFSADSGLNFLHGYTWQPYCEATARFGAGPTNWARSAGYYILDLRKEIGVIFTCVNSSLTGVNHLSQRGEVTGKVWQEISEQLRLMDRDGAALRVLVVHHSLGEGVEKENRLLLTEAPDEPAQLINLLSHSCHFSLILTGHIHELAAHPLNTGSSKRRLVHVGAGTGRSADVKKHRSPQFNLVRLCQTTKTSFSKVDVYPYQWNGKIFSAYSPFEDGSRHWDRFDLLPSS